MRPLWPSVNNQETLVKGTSVFPVLIFQLLCNRFELFFLEKALLFLGIVVSLQQSCPVLFFSFIVLCKLFFFFFHKCLVFQ